MALIDDQKASIVSATRTLANEMARVRDMARGIAQKYASLGLGSGGANELMQADLDAMSGFSGLTVAEYTACITTAEAYETWINAGHDDNMQKIRE